jgi:hypothetical protein
MDKGASELELQQEIERFTTRFAERVMQAASALEHSSHPGERDEVLRRKLLYVSSATEIATGPFPDVNLLDMMVFIHLSRSVLEKHWIPDRYGDKGGDLAEVFARSEEEITEIASQTLSAAHRGRLAEIVDAWLAENPNQYRVEGIRLADFSTTAGSAAAERAAQSKGLLGSVRTATQTASQALLLSERALFLTHRLPFLWRLQARLGAREIVADVLTQLTDGPEALVPRAMGQATALVRRAALYLGLLAGVGILLWWLTWLARR